LREANEEVSVGDGSGRDQEKKTMSCPFAGGSTGTGIVRG
jgi:hypothetical protein